MRSPRRAWLIVTVGLLGMALAAGMLMRPSEARPVTNERPSPRATEQVAPSAPSAPSATNRPAARSAAPTAPAAPLESWQVVGRDSAPVTLVEYMDYRCPSCKAFLDNTESELLRRYVENGQLRIVYKHYAWKSSYSLQAAEAAMCAGAQGRFTEYHHALYANQTVMWFNQQDLLQLADGLKLERSRFEQCLVAGTYREAIRRDVDEAIRLRLDGTPAFTINGKPLVGAQPLPVFIAMIEAALATKP